MWPARARSSSPVAASHTRTVLSQAPLARRVPSGDHATDVTHVGVAGQGANEVGAGGVGDPGDDGLAADFAAVEATEVDCPGRTGHRWVAKVGATAPVSTARSSRWLACRSRRSSASRRGWPGSQRRASPRSASAASVPPWAMRAASHAGSQTVATSS